MNSKTRPFLRFAYWLRRTPPKNWWPQADNLLRQAYFRSPLYPLLEEELKTPEKLEFTPPILWQGDAAHGTNVCKNQFTYLGRTIQFGADVQWFPREANRLWLRRLHSHDWLADLHALNKSGLGHARRLIEDWLLVCSRYHPQVWQQDITAERLINWFTYADWFLKDISSSEREAFLYSLADQANYLTTALVWHRGGAPLIKNLCAIIYAGLLLPGNRSTYLEAMQHLCTQLSAQILADGAHCARSPGVQAEVLKHLIGVRALLLKGKQTVPAQLNDSIEKLAASLSFMQAPDGTLHRMNDSLFHSADTLKMLFKNSGHFEPVAELPETGFYKLEGGKTSVFFNTGITTQATDLNHSHANALAFEVWHNKMPIFQNAGCYGATAQDRTEQRQTAAANTVVIDRISSANIMGPYGIGRRPTKVTTTTVHEPSTGSGIVASHNGYRNVGVTHQRRLFLSENGVDLRGEDTLTAKNKKTHHVAAHFHLHPAIKCHLKDPREAELTLPDGTQAVLKAAGGRFYVQLAPMQDETGGKTQTHRLVLTARWQGNPTVLNWGLKFSGIAKATTKRQNNA